MEMTTPAAAVEWAIRSRRAVRAFLPDPVDPALVRRLLELAAQAPSGTNMQPWKVRVLGPQSRERLESALLAALGTRVNSLRVLPKRLVDRGHPEDGAWGRWARLVNRRPWPIAAAGLAIVDDLRSEPALRGYHLLPSVRGDLLFKLGRMDEARTEFEAAAEMTGNEQERTLLLSRAARC